MMPAISDQDMNAMLAEESRVSAPISICMVMVILSEMFVFLVTHYRVQYQLCTT